MCFSILGMAIKIFHSSGKSYLAINVAGFAFEAPEGKNPGFSSTL